MKEAIDSAIKKLDELSKTKPIKVISHFDTDGITSAAIFSRALQRWNKSFSLEIVKNLEESFISSLPESHILIFLDLASNSLDYLKNKKTEIFILDHHEIIQKIPENVHMINPRITLKEEISSAAICYLFAKSISHHNTDLANLAIIGMIGDSLEKSLSKTYNEILNDSETLVKKGLLIYPATRPLDRALEYSSNPFIPGVTGSYRGVSDLLREIGLQKNSREYKSISELTEEEMSKLITAIMLRSTSQNAHEMIGNIYLIKFFNKMEDARELSALINACSRMDHSYLSLGFCLGNKECKEKAEKIYVEYKQQLISGLKYVNENEKIEGKKYMIINAKDNVKDTIIGTIASIISYSPICERGTIIVALAYNQDKIKVSARIAGKEGGRNVRDVLNQIVVPLGGEVGGHPNAAGCLISKEHENHFISELRKVLEIETIS